MGLNFPAIHVRRWYPKALNGLPSIRRRWVKWVLASTVTLVICGLLFQSDHLHIEAPSRWPFRKSTIVPSSYHPVNLPDDTPDLFASLWKPYLHKLNDTTFITDEGYTYQVAEESLRLKQGLGKKLLILDVDTRLDTGDGSLFNQDPLHFDNMTGRTAGQMNHYMYAMIHGYDYRSVRAPNYRDRHGTWVKVPMIQEALKTHETVVFLDTDAVFMYPHLPLEWLMNLWNITSETLLGIATDPDAKSNRDSKGLVLYNTGFMIAQQSNRTQELFDRWEKCPTEERYSGCKRWERDWAHEQAALGNYVRYDYNNVTDIRVIPCMDGNGAPYIGDKTCGGVFIRHHWFHKELTVRNLHHMILKLMVNRLHGNFHLQKDKYFMDASWSSYPLDGLNI